MDINELYTDLIMEHSTNSPYKKHIDNESCSSLGHNPNCGDEILIQAAIKDGVIKDIAFSGHGCAISQSSTSIMIELLKGKSVAEAKKLIKTFTSMIQREKLTSAEKKNLKNALAFENVANMPSRAKCATLSWHTLENLLSSL